MMRSKNRKVYLMRKVYFRQRQDWQDEDLYSKNDRREQKTASGLVVAGMLLMFPELFIICWELPAPWPSFWALLFVIGAFSNLSGYACLLFGWYFKSRHFKNIRGFIRGIFMRIGGGAYDKRKRYAK